MNIGEVAEIIAGQSPPGSSYNEDGKGLPFFQGKAEFGELFPTPRKWCTEPSKVAQPSDVLISIRAPVGPTNLALTTCCIGRGLAAIRLNNGNEPRFVLYYLRLTSEQLREEATGSTFEAISAGILRDHSIRLAPCREQRRIVDALESYLSRLDDAVTSLERVQRNLKRYRAAVLQAAVQGRLVPTEAELARAEGRSFEPASELLARILTERRRRWEESELAKLRAKGKEPKNDDWKEEYADPRPPDTNGLPGLPEGWCWASVDQLGVVSGGLTKNARRQSAELERPYLRVANVYADRLDLDEVSQIGLDESELARVLLIRDDLLVVEGNGSIDQIGRVAVWDGSIEGCVHQNHIIKVRFDPAALSRWVMRWLLSPSGRREIERAASSTSGLHTLSISKIQSLPTPLAPLGEQVRIAAEGERLKSLEEQCLATIALALTRCSRLRQSILKWAFNGKLVDQDPTDEPASALLERIRAERAAASPDRSKRIPRRKKRVSG